MLTCFFAVTSWHCVRTTKGCCNQDELCYEKWVAKFWVHLAYPICWRNWNRFAIPTGQRICRHLSRPNIHSSYRCQCYSLFEFCLSFPATISFWHTSKQYAHRLITLHDYSTKYSNKYGKYPTQNIYEKRGVDYQRFLNLGLFFSIKEISVFIVEIFWGNIVLNKIVLRQRTTKLKYRLATKQVERQRVPVVQALARLRALAWTLQLVVRTW